MKYEYCDLCGCRMTDGVCTHCRDMGIKPPPELPRCIHCFPDECEDKDENYCFNGCYCDGCASERDDSLLEENEPSGVMPTGSTVGEKNCPKCPECKSHRIIIDTDATNPYECLNCNYSWGSQDIEGDDVTSLNGRLPNVQ